MTLLVSRSRMEKSWQWDKKCVHHFLILSQLYILLLPSSVLASLLSHEVLLFSATISAITTLKQRSMVRMISALLPVSDRGEEGLSQAAVRVGLQVFAHCREVFLPEATHNLYSHNTATHHLGSWSMLAFFHDYYPPWDFQVKYMGSCLTESFD